MTKFNPLEARAGTSRLSGQVVYMYAFDIAYDMTRRDVRELLGQPVGQFAIGASKRSPRQFFFIRPQMIRLPLTERIGLRGPLTLERTIKLLPIGAISITVSVPFSVESLDELVAFHDLRFSDGTFLHDEVRQLAQDVQSELSPYLIRPVGKIADEEAYTAFCIHSPLSAEEGEPRTAEHWLARHRRQIAAVLTEEPDTQRLSEQEVDESTLKSLSYYEQDLVVVDWDAAIIIDEARYLTESLYIMELANVQLAELEAYDRILDAAIERSYRDLRLHRFGGLRTASVLRDLREIRVDMARLFDELSNITKFFGDWHLARIYQSLSTRFHLSDWQQAIDQKLKTLDDLYQLLRADQNNRLMLVLEITIVLLFVIDLVMIGLRLGK